MKQVEAVYKATLAVLSENDISFEEGQVIGDVATPELRKQVIQMVTQLLVSGECDMTERARGKYHTEELMRKEYVPGLVSNWFRKDARLNGGVVYAPKNPGSRAGSSDPEIKNLKLLIASGTLAADKVKIAQERIEQKKQQIAAEKSDKKIDYSAIPDDLLASLGLEE